MRACCLVGVSVGGGVSGGGTVAPVLLNYTFTRGAFYRGKAKKCRNQNASFFLSCAKYLYRHIKKQRGYPKCVHILYTDDLELRV